NSRHCSHVHRPGIPRADRRECVRSLAAVRGVVNRPTIATEDGGNGSVAEPGRALHDRVEDRLQLALRTADYTKDLTGRGLLIERLRQRPILRLELLEQADVLNGDDRLVGKGLEQRNLTVGEGPDLCAADPDDPKSNSFAHERYC